MANFNFKTTESDAPGGGVYKLPGNGREWKIRAADYPEVNLASLTANNFFKRTVCNQSGTASVRNTQDCNMHNAYSGGSTNISYSFANGIGTVTVNEQNRRVDAVLYAGQDARSTQYGSFTHTMYMSRDPIR